MNQSTQGSRDPFLCLHLLLNTVLKSLGADWLGAFQGPWSLLCWNTACLLRPLKTAWGAGWRGDLM